MVITTPFAIELQSFQTLQKLTAPELFFGDIDSITEVWPLVSTSIPATTAGASLKPSVPSPCETK